MYLSFNRHCYNNNCDDSTLDDMFLTVPTYIEDVFYTIYTHRLYHYTFNKTEQ